MSPINAPSRSNPLKIDIAEMLKTEPANIANMIMRSMNFIPSIFTMIEKYSQIHLTSNDKIYQL